MIVYLQGVSVPLGEFRNNVQENKDTFGEFGQPGPRACINLHKAHKHASGPPSFTPLPYVAFSSRSSCVLYCFLGYGRLQ